MGSAGRQLIHKSRKKAKKLATFQEEDNLSQILGGLPGPDEVIRMVSFTEFSACGILRYVVEQAHVFWLGAVTLRVAKKCVDYLGTAAERGRIDKADFILGYLAGERHGGERTAANNLQEICDKYGWSILAARNHAKVLLFDTDRGKFVCETSCNLNDIPNWEQFLFEQDEQLFDFYRDIFYTNTRGPAVPFAESPAGKASALSEVGPWDGPGSRLSSLPQKEINTLQKPKSQPARRPR